MPYRALLFLIPSLFLIACDQQMAGNQSKSDQVVVDIPYEKFTLDNGLRVIVHEDHKAPIVAVNVWYHVGSKDEPEGKSGFAHLFEHLMFNGSENYDSEYFPPFEAVGGSVNGNTWFDRTMYYEVVPTPALEMALWMESDRMGHLLGAVTQEKLDEQRSVVQNEKREGDNQPYGMVGYHQLENLFPVGHPYRHSTIGSMEDLDAASLEDVHAWFKRYYGAGNTVLVLSGDVTAEQARDLAEKYFGDIPAGDPVNQIEAMVPTRLADSSEVMFDRVAQTRINRIWAVAPRDDKDRSLLSLAASILGDGKNSRLYQALIYQQPLAVSVSVGVQPFELTSFFEIEVTVQPGVNENEIVSIVDDVLNDFLANGPTAEELNRVQTGIAARTVRGLEAVNSKAQILGRGELYSGDPAFYKKSLDWVQNASASDVLEASKRWISKGSHQIITKPVPTTSVSESAVDRSAGLPEIGEMPGLTFPDIQRGTLANGMEVLLAERDNLPLVDIALQFDAGYASDAGATLGTAAFALSMLDEGTATKGALEIAEELEMLGATFGAGSNLDTSTIQISALKTKLASTLQLYADLVRHPAFSNDEIERLRGRWIASIAQEKADPISNAIRVLPPLIFGDDHAYGIPLTGSGTEESIAQLTRDDLTGFHEKWIRPDNGTFFVVGDISMPELIAALDAQFGDWQSPSDALPSKNIAEVILPDQGRIVIVDKPGSPTTLILAGHAMAPTGDPRNLTTETMIDILGGQFSSRLNMNLREDKGWAYGSYAFSTNARGQRLFLLYAPVQTDRTADSMNELMGEMTRYLSSAPPTEDELSHSTNNAINGLPGAFETNGAVLSSMLGNGRFGRPDDYVSTLTQSYQAMQINDILADAQATLKPNQMIWLLVGDSALIKEQVRALNIGAVEVWDQNGTVIEQ